MIPCRIASLIFQDLAGRCKPGKTRGSNRVMKQGPLESQPSAVSIFYRVLSTALQRVARFRLLCRADTGVVDDETHLRTGRGFLQ